MLHATLELHRRYRFFVVTAVITQQLLLQLWANVQLQCQNVYDFKLVNVGSTLQKIYIWLVLSVQRRSNVDICRIQLGASSTPNISWTNLGPTL